MITKIPLKEYLKTNELTPGTTLMAGDNIGRFVEEKNGAYGVEVDNLKAYFEAPLKDLYVPISIQKFYVLSSDSPDIEKLT